MGYVKISNSDALEVVNHKVKYANLFTKTAMKKYNSFVVVDFETTGLAPRLDEVIEYAAVRVENNAVVEHISSLCKPLNEIPRSATLINGINNDMVRNSPYFTECLNDLLSFVGTSAIVAHNASFDIGFLNIYCMIMKKPLICEAIDTCNMARRSIPELKNYKLATIAKHLKITETNYHRALGDALVTAEILIKLLSIRDIEISQTAIGG